MSLDIMFLTNDNLRRMRKEPEVLGLRYRGLSNGVENDQNTANMLNHSEPTGKRLSTSSTMSNQSYDSQNVEYAVPKHNYSHHMHEHNGYEIEVSAESKHIFGQQKPTNPLFGVNAASHYSPAPVATLHTNHEDIDMSISNRTYERINSNLPNGIRKAPEGQDNDAFKSEDLLDGRKEMIVSPNQVTVTEGGTATYTTDNNGKINVHVTVMINAGTLADLKKQRSQIRTNGSPVENSITSTGNHSVDSSSDVQVADAVQLPVQSNPLSLSPSSGSMPRFSGNTGDVVGDSQRSHRCCVIV